MRSSEFVSTEEVVSEAIEYIGDTDFTHGVGRSFYELMAHRAIEELALDTFFDQRTTDIFDWNACGEGIIDIPKNCFNIKEMYLFNSHCDCNREGNTTPIVNPTSCCSECSSTDSFHRKHWKNFVNVRWAMEFNKFGSSGISTRERTNLHHYNGWRFGWNGYEGHRETIYFGIQNGKICISEHGTDTRHHYKNMRIVSNTFGTDNCELPIIPRELRSACVDYIKLKACLKLMLLFPEYKQMYPLYKMDLYGDNTVQNPGSWLKATRFISSLNTKQRNDMHLYFSNIETK